jgi:hypothetical protein
VAAALERRGMLEGDANRELTTAREELRKLRDDLKVEQTKGGMFEAATRQVCIIPQTIKPKTNGGAGIFEAATRHVLTTP